MITKKPLASLLLLLAIPAGLQAAAPVSTNSASGREFPSFQIISDRNIFNANRSRGHSGGASADERKPNRVDMITLVGTLSSEKGPYAFFDSTSADFKKVLEPGKTIAGYTLAEVTPTGAKLQSGTNTVDLHVGMKLRREEEGEWQLVPGAGPDPSTTASATVSGSETTTGDESDVLTKKLMQQREQDLK